MGGIRRLHVSVERVAVFDLGLGAALGLLLLLLTEFRTAVLEPDLKGARKILYLDRFTISLKNER